MLTRNFFAQPTLQVAQALLGCTLVRDIEGQRLSGLIIETEAYIGPHDSAAHSSKGRTARTEVMFGPPGHLYVYLIYGMYYMLNFVTEPEDTPAAVLIRAIEPLAGLELMKQHRQRGKTNPLILKNLTNGPGKLCQALHIDRSLNRWDLTDRAKLWVEAGEPFRQNEIATGPRIGIDYAEAKDRAAPWRFWVKGNRFVSTISRHK